MDVEAQIESFRAAFQATGSLARAIGEKAYLKSDLDFFGTDLPTIRATAKGFRRANPDLTRKELLDLVGGVWQTRQHELLMIGIGLLELYVSGLVAEDMTFIEGLLRRSNSWAYVDWLSTKVAGSIVERYPETKTALRRWAIDTNFWVRRASLLALHDALRAGRGDWELFVGLASTHGRRARVLHPQGHRLDPARGVHEAPRAQLWLLEGAHRAGIRPYAPRGCEVPAG